MAKKGLKTVTALHEMRDKNNVTIAMRGDHVDLPEEAVEILLKKKRVLAGKVKLEDVEKTIEEEAEKSVSDEVEEAK